MPAFRRIAAALFVTSMGTAFFAPGAEAAWRPNGSPVAAFSALQESPTIGPDQAGGAFVAWYQQGQVMAQRIGATGDFAAGWPATGLVVPPGRTLQHAQIEVVSVVPGPDGGAYVVTIAEGACDHGCNFDPVQLSVQRITKTGTLETGWPAEGVRAEHSWMDHGFALSHRSATVPDGAGSILLAWLARVPYTSAPPSMRIQSITADGTRRWGDDGVEIGSGAGLKSNPEIVADGLGGAFVFWADSSASSAGTRIFGQHVSAAGVPIWNARGRAISQSSTTRVVGPTAIPDGANGAFVTWSANVESDLDVWAARVAPDGSLPWIDDMPLATASGDQTLPRLVAVPGGAIVAWLDFASASNVAVRAQRLGAGGTAEWAPEGVAICTAPGSRQQLVIASDGRGGAYAAWGDSRSEGFVFASRVTGNGSVARGWPEDGAPVCADPGLQKSYVSQSGGIGLVAVGGVKAMLSWVDTRPFPPGTPSPGPEQSFVMMLTPTGPAASPGDLPLVRVPVSIPPVSATTSETHRGGRLSVQVLTPVAGSRERFARVMLPEPGATVLELFDVSGRKQWSRDLGALDAGEHRVRLGADGSLPPGIYLVRLTQNGRVAKARVTFLR